MKTKPRFRIGDWVRVKAIADFYYTELAMKKSVRKVESRPLRDPIIGQIVGARIKFLGEFKGGGYRQAGMWDEDVDYDPPYLSVSNSVTVWLVRKGYLNKAVEVLDGDIELVEEIHSNCIRLTIQDRLDRKLPWRKTKQIWDEKAKEELRKIMKDHPRDEKGRWEK
jgi:hypothetical protein